MGQTTGADLRRVQDADVARKTVLVRVDYNVPIQQGKIANDERIRASLPTIRWLVDHGAKTVLVTHLGRPDGRPMPEMSVRPLAERLSQLLERPVHALTDSVGPAVEKAVKGGRAGDIFLLENVRFHTEEEANDATFAAQLASVADLFVNDAFGTLHRAHASTAGVAAVLPAYAGLLVQREVEVLSGLLVSPPKPYVGVIGGKKAKSKLGPIRDLLPRLDAVLIGGGVAFTFLKAMGASIGDSVVDEEFIEEAREILRAASERGVEIQLPEDVRVARVVEADAETRVCPARQIPDGWMGIDIGPETIRRFAERIASAKTILWTGPMGAFETPPFDQGTRGVAEAVAASDAFSVVGGGETGEAIESLGYAARVSYISTGGGACLAFLRGKTLPALDVLRS